MTVLQSLSVFVLIICVDYTWGCSGLKLRMNKIENCGGDDQIITVDSNFTANLSPACVVTTNGCITSKGFTKAKVDFSILKNGVVMLSGNPDLCDALDKKSAEAKGKLALFGFPTECPIPEERRCLDGNKSVDVTKYKNFLNLAIGKMEIDAKIEHDTGKSCLKFTFELYK